MKIQCNVCEKAEARVLCCADEAALCEKCDDKVHAANKLASKHHRLSLSHSSSHSHSPLCDICQEAVGSFFCLEDRALLCRQCDIAIHSANSFVSSHQRFLLTGVRVGLEAAEPGSSLSQGRTQSGDRGSGYEDNRDAPKPIKPTSTTNHYDRTISGQTDATDNAYSNKRSMPMSMSEYARIQPVQNGTLEDLTQSRTNFAGGSNSGDLSQWPLEEFLGMSDFHHDYSFTGNGSSKADSGKLGSSDSSTFLRSMEFELDSDDQLGQVPEVSWAVPEIHSPPTASGLYWPERSQLLAENVPFVPDISWSQTSNCQHYQPNHNAGKRRRQT